MDLKVSNGPDPGDERTTSLLLLGFLQSCPHSCFQRELEALGHELPGRLFHDDELQTDGNRCSHFPLAAEAETGQEAVPGGCAGTAHANLPSGHGPREDPAPAHHALGQKDSRPLASLAPRCLPHNSDLHQPEPPRLCEELSPKYGLSDHSAKADCEDAGGVNTVAAASTDTSFGR
ncbi:BH3-interacting domain death agonist isoform X4 [Bubalus kerabau]|uniref:BH3-interacting domain death agonist isoform X4 n=1 Tax=Bubalus carabanensis TaxID=3119969 RepID=UPI00244EE66A|nr:BH3-interacting domain death agonist isoform X4 [Bubalus carabanensis]